MTDIQNEEQDAVPENGVGLLGDSACDGKGTTLWARFSDSVADVFNVVRDITADVPGIAVGTAACAGMLIGAAAARRPE